MDLVEKKKKTKTRSTDTPNKVSLRREVPSPETIQQNQAVDLTDPQIKAIYDTVKGMIIGKQITVVQLTSIIPLAMQSVSLVNMSGAQKKDVLIKIFRYIVNDMNFDTAEQKALAQTFVENDLGTLIDTAYQASQGTFSFNGASAIIDNNQVDLIYNNIKQSIVNQQISISTIIILVPTIMVQVGKFVGISGLQKKDLVVQLVVRLLGEIKTDDENYQVLLAFAKEQLPTVVDIVYNSAASKYVFKKIESGCSSFWSCKSCKK